jgi:hypothetical protein
MACNRGKASPNEVTRLRLFAASAGLCQRPECLRPLFVETENGSIHIAEMAHVFAAKDQGPRANPTLTEQERGAFENLILLCPGCHTIIDKSPISYPDKLLIEWKRRHAERIAATFGAIEYESRGDARSAIEPALAENATIFLQLGPDNEYRANPESELAQTWRWKVQSRIIPNNRKVLAIIDANRRHLNGRELLTLEEFRQHVNDLEVRHLEGRAVGGGRRFPEDMRDILRDPTDV